MKFLKEVQWLALEKRCRDDAMLTLTTLPLGFVATRGRRPFDRKLRVILIELSTGIIHGERWRGVVSESQFFPSSDHGMCTSCFYSHPVRPLEF
jgi:hypothetical protein